MVPDPLVGEISLGVSPPGGAEDVSHGSQTLVVRYVSVPTYWVGAGNGGNGGDRGIYGLPPEHRRVIHCNPSYPRLVFGGRAESGNVLI